jgi:hypothetical protein
MKRYQIICDYGDHNDYEPEECTDGFWVKFEDVEAELSTLKAELGRDKKELIDALQFLWEAVQYETDNQEDKEKVNEALHMAQEVLEKVRK